MFRFSLTPLSSNFIYARLHSLRGCVTTGDEWKPFIYITTSPDSLEDGEIYEAASIPLLVGEGLGNLPLILGLLKHMVSPSYTFLT
jgi:hypothetical protein